MFEAVEELIGEHADLEKRLADPAVHADQAEARKLNKRYAELTPIVTAYRPGATGDDLGTARELAADDPDFAAEVKEMEQQREELDRAAAAAAVPRDPSDDKDVILEVKAGEGGEESALFAGDLLRMYLRYAERVGWKTEILDANESDLGGYKDVQVAVKTKGGRHEPGQGVWARLKYEGGVHRVQRVPATESQGRIHTSAAGVLVTPEAEEVEVEIGAERPADRRLPLVGPGGQSVNTTDSAVRITHLPTGLVVSCQNEKSQLQNKESAMRILRSRLLAAAQEEAEQEASDARRSQVRTVDRSERIRTYNFPENRISDHRVGFKAYNLDQVLDGDLDAMIQACVDADSAAKLAAAATATAGRASNEGRTSSEPAARRGGPGRPAAGRRRRALAALRRRGTRGVRARRQARRAAHASPTREFDARYWEAVARREAREPLQHITGRAFFRYLELQVGPGRVRAPPGDRVGRRLGDRRAYGPWTSPSR